jgi:hypothetical protein
MDLLTDRDYITRRIEQRPSFFLYSFLTACQSADTEEFEMLLPVLRQVREKYPLRPETLNEKTWG